MLNLTPGETQLVFPEQLENLSTFTTHALPLQMFNTYLKKFTNSKIALLLIQPKNVELGETITTELKKIADQIESILTDLFATL
jgi:Ni,Fe-hydrogenase maturation factor